MRSIALQPQHAASTREVQWNVGPELLWLMYGSMVVAFAIFTYGIWCRVQIWRLGKPERRWDCPWERTKRILVESVAQAALLREPLPGLMHALVFFGFLVLFAATVVVMIHHDLGIPIMRGRFYLYFQSLTVNLLGFLALLGVAAAACRRYLVRPAKLEHSGLTDALVLGSLFLILVTGFMISGIRILATEDSWGLWRPISYAAGSAIAAAAPTGALEELHSGLWAFHVLLWHAFLAAIPYSKMFHIASSPLNVYLGNRDPKGVPPPIDFDGEEVPELGINSPFDMTWKQLLDLDACTECGRCEAVCPAYAEGKPLSPKRVILDLRDHVHTHAKRLRQADTARRSGDAAVFDEIVSTMPGLAGGVIRHDTLWCCTTCRACEQACPVSIEHVRLIVQLRQHLAMEQADVPPGVADLVESLDARQHPFRGVPVDRNGWYASPVTAQSDGSAEGKPL